MSAALNTSIEMKGTNDELKKMIMVIKDYSGYNHDASLDFIKIKSKDDKTIENIDDMSKKIDIQNSETHRALADAITTARVLLKLKEMDDGAASSSLDDMLSGFEGF